MSAVANNPLAQTVLSMLHEWQICAEDQLCLLGLKGQKPRTLRKYQQGAEIPASADTEQRMRCLVQIHQGLQTLFPHSANLCDLWITTPNRALGDATPLSLMLDQELAGMQRIAEILDNRSLY